MGLTDLVLLVLLCTALVFSIIELGLSADAVDLSIGASIAHDRFSFIVFCSVWTLLLASFFIFFPYLSSRRDTERLMAPLTIALNAVTMIFWLAGFAAVADLFDGGNPQGVAGALLAFAVMIWLLFLAILVLNILTATGVLRSERMGHSRLTTGKPAATA